MKKLLINLLLICTLCSACAQKKNNQKDNNLTMIPISKKSKHITKENFVEEIYNRVQRFDKEPMYFIRPAQGNCVYEILINDFPVVKDYSIEQFATPIRINQAILKSGLQTVTVRLYPIGNTIKRAYGEGETVTTLLPKTQMNIQVVKYDAFNIDSSLDAEKEVILHKAPTDKEGKFIGAGLPYYEYTFTFEAEVPYEIESWKEGEDLINLDKERLEKIVVDYYQKMEKLYNSKNIDLVLKAHFMSELKDAQALYRSKDDIQEVYDWLFETVNIQTKEFFPLKKYEIKFFGNGKIICLKNPSKEPINRKFRGKSAFSFKFRDSNFKLKGRWIDLYLYLPEGEPLENLRVID
jgi:hypothetical protein